MYGLVFYRRLNLLRLQHWAALAALVLLALAPSVTNAQAMREISIFPADCRDQLPPHTRGTIQRWQVFVRLEHCDRVKRLQRLATQLPSDQRPRFFEGIVPASRLPSGFSVDMPVLRVVFPERVFFDTNRATMRLEAQEIAGIVADSMARDVPDVALFVAGHADARGDRMHNENLSIDRANVIAEWIIDRPRSSGSVWRVGFGEDMPLVSGETSNTWDRNRRVEFLFAGKPEAVGVWLADQQIDGLCQGRTLSESQTCKSNLNLRDSYDATELVKLKPSKVTRTSPRPGQGASVSPKLPSAQTGVAIGGNKGITVKLESGRVYRIKPTLRQMEPVRVRL
jgi:outer membrane protein OmpA-like peptidoglycan-associated protein